MKKIFLTLAFLILSFPALAGSQDVAVIQVKGMVCDFCAQAVTRVFLKQENVADVKVDLDAQTISLFFEDKEISLTEAQIKEGVHYSGYDFVSYEVTQEAAE